VQHADLLCVEPVEPTDRLNSLINNSIFHHDSPGSSLLAILNHLVDAVNYICGQPEPSVCRPKDSVTELVYYERKPFDVRARSEAKPAVQQMNVVPCEARQELQANRKKMGATLIRESGALPIRVGQAGSLT
jgi:hypothetical protein